MTTTFPISDATPCFPYEDLARRNKRSVVHFRTFFNQSSPKSSTRTRPSQVATCTRMNVSCSAERLFVREGNHRTSIDEKKYIHYNEKPRRKKKQPASQSKQPAWQTVATACVVGRRVETWRLSRYDGRTREHHGVCSHLECMGERAARPASMHRPVSFGRIAQHPRCDDGRCASM